MKVVTSLSELTPKQYSNKWVHSNCIPGTIFDLQDLESYLEYEPNDPINLNSNVKVNPLRLITPRLYIFTELTRSGSEASDS